MVLKDNSSLVYDQFLEEAIVLGNWLYLHSAFEIVESIYVKAKQKTIKHRNEPQSSSDGEFLTVVFCIDERSKCYCTIDEFRQILIDEGLSRVVRFGEWSMVLP